VIDSFFGFTEALGIKDKHYRWDVPIPEEARQFAAQYLKQHATLVISPCSSKAYRNWSCEGYAALADYAYNKHGMQVILTGGASAIEQQYGECIVEQSTSKPLNLVGKTTIKQLLAILEQATLVVAPDSGPAHFATAVNTPVIGLYACTNPDRARPYLSEQWLVNRYPQAIQKKYGKPVDDVPWGTRVRDAGTMQLITVEDVCNKLDQFLETQ
jgi:heptosyltransferase I